MFYKLDLSKSRVACPVRYARGLLVRVSLDRFGRELLRKSQAELTQLMKRREELGEGVDGFGWLLAPPCPPNFLKVGKKTATQVDRSKH